MKYNFKLYFNLYAILPLTHISILDEIQMPNQHLAGSKINTTSCGNTETVSGNAMFVNVHNSNETLKTSQEKTSVPTPYHSFVNSEPKSPLPHHSDKTSTTNISMLPSNAKTEPSLMASSIPAISTYKKSLLPQDTDRRESNMDNNRTLSEDFKVNHKSNMNDTMAIKPPENASDSKIDIKSNNELNEKCDLSSRNVGCLNDRTDKSDKSDNQKTKETVKHSGATEHSVETMVNHPQVAVVSNKLPLQSQPPLGKADAHQSSSDEIRRKIDGSDVRKNIDSTLNLGLLSHSSKSGGLDNKSEGEISSSNAKSLASLDKAIAEKKATAMLPIQKTATLPPKSTSSLFGGKLGGSKLVDGLLKQAEARAAKEASEAAAAASAKNNDSKQEISKEILVPSSNTGTRSDTDVKMSSKSDNEKGKKCPIFYNSFNNDLSSSST